MPVQDRNLKRPMTPSDRIDQMAAELIDWRGTTFAGIRKSVLAADRGIVEDWKWMGSPVWSCDGLIAVANAHKGKVKLTFAYGAHFADPDKLFNAGFEGNARRAIDFFEGDKIDARALTDSRPCRHRLQSDKEEESARPRQSAQKQNGMTRGSALSP